jgi:hypothetical protein
MLVKNQTEAESRSVARGRISSDHGPRIKAKPVWPEYWKLDELEKVQATLPVAKWNAQWMQSANLGTRSFVKTRVVACL